MTTLVVGASGATGRLVVEKLLADGEAVRIIVRSTEYLPNKLKTHPKLSITQASLLDLTDKELQSQVLGCRAIVCCLGHNMTLKGIYGQPRKLVTDAVARLCTAIERCDKSNHDHTTKFILMSSSGVQNPQTNEKVPLSQKIAVKLIRCLVPPHKDNETAAEYLQSNYPDHQDTIEWVAVRPDSLTNEIKASAYDVSPTPVRNVIFDAGASSRINVAYFIASLVNQADLWNHWKMRMPVIYNR
ncbi:hypothetical protein DS2_12018 [Catenovulum agarivorans DS-2]|uniref:NAD(P)-binding domain-containing protein n=1 Tax=Catenovulum agarivorans DS-2 TaxID=1328313 RepID=W7QKS3_9ALTE|nr:NAD(P)-binding oxidoreductase [Catenovulum agarivorans]EWH09557.1 hypothetical protein DS2_12018 [Catenovulum agarivorans DS-2]